MRERNTAGVLKTIRGISVCQFQEGLRPSDLITGAGKPAKGISPIRAGRRAEPMEVVALVFSVLGLAATLFAIGYELGKDIHDHHDKTQK